LYRNDAGANYPYNIGSIMSITGNSADPDYYYFYYDIEVEVPCENTTTAVSENPSSKNILKVVDILGREVKGNSNIPLFYIYDNGTAEKQLIIE